MRDTVRVAYAAMAIVALCIAAPLQAKSKRKGGQTPSFSATLLDEHNKERAALGLMPLIWSAPIAVEAAAYAAKLAESGKFEHAPPASRPNQGENLWMGNKGAYSAKDMVGLWVAEKKKFRPGQFPNVSSTGNWLDVGHYSQIIWPRTTTLGCALASNKRIEYLVCRYSAAGNVWGQKVP